MLNPLKFFKDFFQDIGNFISARSVLGVDIGTTSLKVVELARKGDNLSLLNYGILETQDYLNHPNQAIQTSSLKISEKETATMLKALVGEMHPKARLAVGTIPSFAAFQTLIDMPLLSPQETAKAVEFQAPQYIPIPIADVTVDWLKVDEFQTENRETYQRIFLIGIPKDILERYKTVFRSAGLKLAALELDGIALARSLLVREDEPTLLIDLGALTSNIFVIRNGRILYASQTDYGGIYLTQAIARSLGITNARAEELKRRRGLTFGGPEAELSTLTLPFLDVIIQEVNHTKSVMELRYGRKLKRAMLAGAGAELLGVEKYFGSQLDLPIVKPNPFLGVGYPLSLEPILLQLSKELPVALGAAERYFS
jgi:type IV pilus assembly protein PilM